MATNSECLQNQGEGYIEIREEQIGRFEGEVIYPLPNFNESLFSHSVYGKRP